MKIEESLSILNKLNNAFTMHKNAYLLESDFDEKTRYYDELVRVLKEYQYGWSEIFESLNDVIFERYERNFITTEDNILCHKESGAAWSVIDNKIEFNIYKESPWKIFPDYNKNESMNKIPDFLKDKSCYNIIGGDKFLFTDFVKQAYSTYVEVQIPYVDRIKVNNQIISIIQQKLKEAGHFPFEKCLIDSEQYHFWIDTDWCNWQYVINKDIFAFFFDNETLFAWMEQKENDVLIDMLDFLKEENYKRGSYKRFNMYDFELNTKFSDYPIEEEYKKDVVRYMNSVVFKQFYEIPVIDFDNNNELQNIQYSFQHAMLSSVKALLKKIQSCNNDHFEKWLISSYSLEKIDLIKKALGVDNGEKLITVGKEKINELLPMDLIQIKNNCSEIGTLFIDEIIEKKETEIRKTRQKIIDNICKAIRKNNKQVVAYPQLKNSEVVEINTFTENEHLEDKLVLNAFNEKNFLLLRSLKDKGWTIEKEIRHTLNKNNYNIIDFIFDDGNNTRPKSEIEALLDMYIENEEDLQLLLNVNSIHGNALAYFVNFYHRQGYLNKYIKFLIKNGQSLDEYSMKHDCAIIDIVNNEALSKLIRVIEIQAQKEKIEEQITEKVSSQKEIKRI